MPEQTWESIAVYSENGSYDIEATKHGLGGDLAQNGLVIYVGRDQLARVSQILREEAEVE